MFPKPISIKYLALPVLILATFVSHSQDLPYLRVNNAGGVINLSIAAPEYANIISWNDHGSSQIANQYAVWLEKGDGNYVCNFAAGLDNIRTTSLPTPPLMLASKLYEHSRRPPTSTSSSLVNFSGIPQKMSAPELRNGQVKLFKNVYKVVPNDPMVFGISYVPKPVQGLDSTTYKLIFRYNSAGQKTFNAITDPGNRTNTLDYTTNRAVAIKDIRNYNNETVSIAKTGDLKNYTTGAVFENALVFENIASSSDSFNIFISVLPLDLAIDELPKMSNVEVEILYKQKEGNWKSIETSSITGLQTAAAHDPNSITVFPRCLPLPQINQTLHYTIHFQNTGPGNADTVKAVFYFPGQINRTKKIWNLKAAYSDISNYTITDIQYDWANNRVIFTMDPTTDQLDGTQDLPNPVTNPKTMGQISFDLEITAGADPLQPAILEAWAEIFFHGVNPSAYTITQGMLTEGMFIPGTNTYELPIRTGNAVSIFSNCCTAAPGCNCKQPGNLWQWLMCYWWILVIIILIFVILWLYKRRRNS